ncbi:GC-rich sequence DNA-binding factor-like protein-domain-containing protein [Phlyctochytrium arcticum]|nr:GC-rich sequence DNA-binding factor-like protein-domain-containing protein [Phlyctochytrium arcticum]
MGRRKAVLEDDGDSSSDEHDEEDTFQPNGRRKGKRSKDDAIYGVFGSDDDEVPRDRGQRDTGRYMGGVQFVAGAKSSVEQSDPMDADSDGSEEDDQDMPYAGLGSSEREREGDDQDMPYAGLGSSERTPKSDESKFTTFATDTPTKVTFPSSSRSFTPLMNKSASPLPTSFGSASKLRMSERKQNSFGSPASSYGSPGPDRDFGKFESSTKGIGSKLMEKMGWVRGQGLGKDGAGISAPIDVKLRPKQAGLGAVDERTEDIKREQQERRALGLLSSDEDEEKGKAATSVRTGQWRKNARSGKKVAYKSAEELLAEKASDGPVGPTVATKILDMTGREVRELTDISQAGASAPFEVTAARLPELRHNLRLLAGMAQQDLLHVKRQAQLENKRQSNMSRQQVLLENVVEDESGKAMRLKMVVELANECEKISRQFTVTMRDLDFETVENAFAMIFNKIKTELSGEFKSYGLDQLVVASVAPIVRKLLQDWNLLEQPAFASSAFRSWQKLLMATPASDQAKSFPLDRDRDQVMTPYESMLYEIWLPKVRQAVNNDWDPKSPDPVIQLLDIWHLPSELESHSKSPLLPEWLYYNILDQLIVPKLSREVGEWTPSKDPPIHTWIHPWLPHLADRMHELLIAIRHKLTVSLRDWEASNPQTTISILLPWQQVFQPSEMESLLAKVIIPKLILHLRNNFIMNPAQQDLQPLYDIFQWQALLPIHLLVHLLESEFFPKWHSVLWQWLGSPGAQTEEISQWYQSWKRVFPPMLAKEAGIVNQFRAGLNMMNQSLAMGGAKGPMPAPPPPIAETSQTAAAGGKVSLGMRGKAFTSTNFGKNLTERSTTAHLAAAASSASMSALDSFRDYVDRLASEHDLLFVPANRVHPVSGKQLSRIAPASKAALGMGGIIVYMDAGVLFMDNGAGEWKPVSVDEAMEIAKKG